MSSHSQRTRPSKHNLSSIRGFERAPLARWVCRRTLLFAPAFVALGCSSQGDVNVEAARPTRARLAIEPVKVSVPSVTPSTVVLGQPFEAVVNRPGQYTFGGEGVRVTSLNGNTASLICTWAGFHTIEVTAKNTRQLTAQIYCSPPPCDDGICPGVPVAPEQPLECPNTNVLIRVDKNDEQGCPKSTPGWVGGELMDAVDPAADRPPPTSNGDTPPSTDAAKKIALLPRVDRFCSYYWNGAPGQYASAQPPLPPSGVSSDRTWDCAQVSAHGGTDDLNAVLASHGREELGTLSWKLDTDADTFPVRIAVVDTAAGSWSDPDNNPHGKAVGTLALDTACADQTSCKVNVENYLGLPLYREEVASPANGAVVRRDIEHGGSFGARGDLVRAILDAVNAAPAEIPLVLNLSLAYEAELPGLLPTAGDFPDRVVLEALYYARCRGALILAAAGNGSVPADPEQHAGFPARWTGLPALSDQQCRDRFGISRFGNPITDPGPLLYAVSAVDFAAKPLLTTRGKGQSLIAALGFQAVRMEPGGSYTRRLTGTSMATATVSGITASAWSHDPSLSPDVLMRRLYNASAPIGSRADFAPVGYAGREVRRITHCSIAKAFTRMAKCVDDPTPEAAILAGTPPVQTADAAQPEPSWTITDDHHSWDLPWLFPQPIGDPGCGACSMVPGQLNLAFRASFLNGSVSYLRLLARKPAPQNIAGIMNLTGGGSADDSSDLLVEDIPEPQTAPFNVPLDDLFDGSSAAELGYKIQIAGVTFDTTESVLIQESSDADAGADAGAPL